MTRNRAILFFGAAMFLTLSASPSRAQIIDRRATVPSDATTIEALMKRVEALESQVAQLKQQTAFIKSVNPLVFDAAGAAISIRGGSIRFDVATGFDVMAGSNASLRAGNAMNVEAAAGLDLKGSVVKLNGGGRPVACAGSTGTPAVCGVSVLVPQN